MQNADLKTIKLCCLCSKKSINFHYCVAYSSSYATNILFNVIKEINKIPFRVAFELKIKRISNYFPTKTLGREAPKF